MVSNVILWDFDGTLGFRLFRPLHLIERKLNLV
jgi:hypothetical protein